MSGIEELGYMFHSLLQLLDSSGRCKRVGSSLISHEQLDKIRKRSHSSRCNIWFE